ncbi:MAG TPA: GntR family transcriptional regulator [Vicinamibacterales bacterium]|jgi:GntR family transcriptional regulator|nr:GntR family transcriptional regulator [Vicinamibacterales bacterium]
MTFLRRDLPVPLYHQLKMLILREIEGGHLKPDDQLPTEDQLAQSHKVSKITVRQALQELASEGYIRRQQGLGTFVQRPRVQQGPRELTSFTDEMRRHGLASTSRVLEQDVSDAPPEVATKLTIHPPAQVFRLRRLRLANGEPMGVQTAYLPLDLVPGIGDARFVGGSLYELLQSRYGLHPATARETYCVVPAGREEAGLLHVPVGSPAMAAERVTFLADGRALEYVQSVMRGDRYRIVVDLTRHA